MMKNVLFLFMLIPLVGFSQVRKTKLTAEEYKLYTLINDYRKSKGLKAIPLSNSLSIVAQTHARDMANNPNVTNGECNLHSWSDKGNWTGCCYTSDHKQAKCMWDKPKELTSYPGVGYEISHGGTSSGMAASSLEGWKASYHYNNVIINEDIWKKYEWKAIGIGMYEGSTHVWFGAETDPEGEPIVPGSR